jgi:pimeloyl-ACP methyl ester carboxylesterase
MLTRDLDVIEIAPAIYIPTNGLYITDHWSVAEETPMARAILRVSTSYGDIGYTQQGSGPAALFIHGVFLNGYLWRHVIDQVSDIRRCIAVDLMAHGASPVSENQDLSFRAQAEMLDAFCTALGLQQVDLVANDSGGGIAQIFAARHPARIRSLTLTNCDTHDNYPPRAFEPVRAAARSGMFSARRSELLSNVELSRSGFAQGYEHPERVTAETLRTYLQPIYATEQATRNLERWLSACGDNGQIVEIEPLLRQLHAPTLIVWGSGDIFFPVRWAHWLRDTIPGTRKVIELVGAKLLFPEERPQELAAPLREHWLASA